MSKLSAAAQLPARCILTWRTHMIAAAAQGVGGRVRAVAARVLTGYIVVLTRRTRQGDKVTRSPSCEVHHPPPGYETNPPPHLVRFETEVLIDTG
ncbi:hypothetical protein BDZ91DRAFT_716561 [Kalaharituber pfeilii]|nr:hypothetical protein BDZ91DRAFT_716561 [Kalaharituber pfeilii]